MKRNWNVIKNMAWAVSILACLLVLFVALIIAAATPYSGDIVRGGVDLNRTEEEEGGANALTTPEPVSDLQLLGQSGDAGQGYIDGLTFLCDSSIIGLRDYGILTDGTATTQVWGSTAGNIPAGSLADCRIRFPSDGTERTPAEAAALTRPARLIIVLGTDGLDTIDEVTFVEGYVSLIRSIQAASPETVIIVCSVSSVTTSYNGADGLNANVIRTVNTWIQTVCMRTGVYYADTASMVNDNAGWLDSDYASANGKALNTAGIQRILEYLRNHAV